MAIQSVYPRGPEKRGEIRRIVEVTAGYIKQLGGSVELVDMGKQKLPEGSEIPLPPILLGKLGSDPQKKPVCVCGHLDVAAGSPGRRLGQRALYLGGARRQIVFERYKG